jgi:putative cardiolipin synthase
MINTEAGLYVESEVLARQVAAFMDDGIAPDNAFRVQLGADGRLVWSAEEDGKPIRYDVEPMSTTGQRMQAGFIRLLPVEKQL